MICVFMEVIRENKTGILVPSTALTNLVHSFKPTSCLVLDVAKEYLDVKVAGAWGRLRHGGRHDPERGGGAARPGARQPV